MILMFYNGVDNTRHYTFTVRRKIICILKLSTMKRND